MVHILTHNDLDGYAAGFIAQGYYDDKEQTSKVHIMDYGKELPIDEIKLGDTIVITDFSLELDIFDKLCDIIGPEGSIIWIDHHITAIDKYTNAGMIHKVDGLRSIKYCGAVLTYLYFNVEHPFIVKDLDEDNVVENIPRWLRIVDAWDTWKLDSKYRKEGEALNTAVRNILSIELMHDIGDPDAISDAILEKYIEVGNTYIEYKKQWSKQFREQYGFEKVLHGTLFGIERDVKCKVLTIGNADSTYFGEDIDNYDVCITQCFDGDGWKVSLYSNKQDIDTSICAKYHGGGGHKGASGCYFKTIYPPAFKSDNKTLIEEIKKYEGEV